MYGFIGTNIVWAQENTAYTLDGPIAVNNGVTLTVKKPGVNVNLNNYYIQVNGTLIARSTNADKITFTGGSVEVTSINQQLGQLQFLRTPYGIISSPCYHENYKKHV